MENHSHLDIIVQFPGIELESKALNGAVSALTVLELFTEQDAYEVEVNVGLI